MVNRRIRRLVRSFSSQPRIQPSFFILGTQKGGTTSLFKYLEEHPSFRLPRRKEIQYFTTYYHKGTDWYYRQFPVEETNGSAITGEATPYYLYHPLAPKRLHMAFPNAKLIMLLRDPVSRAYSHYQHNREVPEREPLSFEEAIRCEEERLAGELEHILRDPQYVSEVHQHYSYQSRGIYIDQLKRWEEFFPREQMLILKSEDFFKNIEQVTQQVFSFLEVPPYQLETTAVHNQGSYQQKSSEESKVLANLRSYFVPVNQQLYDYLGRDMGWGSKSS